MRAVEEEDSIDLDFVAVAEEGETLGEERIAVEGLTICRQIDHEL